MDKANQADILELGERTVSQNVSSQGEMDQTVIPRSDVQENPTESPEIAQFPSPSQACDGGTQRDVDGHNDALEDEAKRGKVDITELIAEEQEKD
jgi:hypothetical protein